jgi:ligand-binding SRPBCC domain-containing protein
MSEFAKETWIDAPRELVFAFHQRPDAFALLLPPWEKSRVLRPPTSLEVGTLVVVETKLGPLWVRIEAEHVVYVPNERFEDVMRKGPFARWHHRHLFVAQGAGCLLRDEITYELPLGALGRTFGGAFARQKLERMFAYRHVVTAREVASMRGQRASRSSAGD